MKFSVQRVKSSSLFVKFDTMIISSINTQILAIYLTLFVSCVLVQGVLVSKDDSQERTDSGVLILNEANIEDAIKGNELIVITFCKRYVTSGRQLSTY